MAPEPTHPIEDAATSLLVRLSEQTEDIMDECCAELWPDGDEDWWGGLGDDDLRRASFSEHVFGAVQRRFAQLIVAAAEAAEKRGGPRPVEWASTLRSERDGSHS